MQERLQKILSRAGFGSRRDCEKLIIADKVKVNGVVAVIGQKADPSQDQISVNGKIFHKISHKKIYISFYKPRGILSEVSDVDNRRKVRDFIPLKQHLFIVGRLDKESEGLILLTNDGELANKLTHPRFMHEKEYQVLLNRRPDKEQLEIWQRGIVLKNGYRTQPVKIKILQQVKNGCWVNIIMKEGKKRQIRESAERIGLFVKRLIRIRISSLELGDLKKREWRYLSNNEIKKLIKSI